MTHWHLAAATVAAIAWESLCGLDAIHVPFIHVANTVPESTIAAPGVHIADEFEVERTASHETRRPDNVLFVNGIPLVVIECKRPDLKDALEQCWEQFQGEARGAAAVA